MSTTVQGVLDHMIEYSDVSARMGDALEDQGAAVERTIRRLNESSEETFGVPNSGPLLIHLGAQIREVDQFAKSIAEALRQADSPKITNEMEAAAAKSVLAGASDVERMAGDLAFTYLLVNFDNFDSAKNGMSDGLVSMNDVERVAKNSKDPAERAAANWLLEHNDVFKKLDRTGSALDKTDDLIDRDDIVRYLLQRAAYQVLRDNLGLFDSATTGKFDGKVSRKDVEHILARTSDPNIAGAAKFLLENPATLNHHIAFGDDLVGRYELEKIANQNGEPAPREKVQVHMARTIGCGAAKEMSWVSYVDTVQKMRKGESAVVDGGKDVAKQAVKKFADDQVEDLMIKKAIGLTGRETGKLVAAKSISAVGGAYVGAAATGVDLACRATAPDTSSGSIKVKKVKKVKKQKKPLQTESPSTEDEMAQKG
jgi:hypothetical protein